MNKQIVYSTETISNLDIKGDKRYWVGHILQIEEDYFTQQEYWSIKKDGSESIHQFSEPILVISKNVGKKNETTPYQQSLSEITSLYKSKLDKGYSTTGDSIIFLPMLAHEFQKKKPKFPAYVQPKLDGIRSYRTIDGKFWTRYGKQVDENVVSHLTVNTDIILDGELILPAEVVKDSYQAVVEEGNISQELSTYTFEQTVSAVKKYSELSKHLIYYVFDCYDPKQPDLTYEERLDLLSTFELFNLNKQVVVLETYYCKELSKFIEYAEQFIERGYEGAIYRSLEGKYKVNGRSSDLLKYKKFVDAEFKIVDVIEGEGRDKGAAIFICITEEGNEFKVRPNGSIDNRKEIFNNKEYYIGKLYTVKYQGLTGENKVPRFPVGITLRNYE